MSQLITLLNNSNVEYKTHGEDSHVSSKSGWIGLKCPWCRSDKYHLGINIHSLACKCWRCGSHSTASSLSYLCKLPYKEVIGFLQKSDIKVSAPQKTGFFRLPNGLCDFHPVHIDYLKSRGFDPYLIKDVWGVKATTLHPRLGWRLFIPIYDRTGREVSWTTRSVSAANPQRYVSASSEEEEIPHKNILYGAEKAINSIVVCEGPLSVWAIGPGAVCTFGVSITEQQRYAISDYPIRAICFDSDASGIRESKKLCDWLSQFPGQTHRIRLESGKDPAECSLAEITEIRKKYL